MPRHNSIASDPGEADNKEKRIIDSYYSHPSIYAAVDLLCDAVDRAEEARKTAARLGREYGLRAGLVLALGATLFLYGTQKHEYRPAMKSNAKLSNGMTIKGKLIEHQEKLRDGTMVYEVNTGIPMQNGNFRYVEDTNGRFLPQVLWVIDKPDKGPSVFGEKFIPGYRDNGMPFKERTAVKKFDLTYDVEGCTYPQWEQFEYEKCSVPKPSAQAVAGKQKHAARKASARTRRRALQK